MLFSLSYERGTSLDKLPRSQIALAERLPACNPHEPESDQCNEMVNFTERRRNEYRVLANWAHAHCAFFRL